MWEVPRFFERAACRVGSFVLSTEEIEHGVLRGNRPSPLAVAPPFGAEDPRRVLALPLDTRIHFALNCGARSCPPVRRWSADRLDQELDAAVASFLADTVRFERGVVWIPELFRWFAADFAEFSGGLVTFLTRYLSESAARRAIAEHGMESVDFAPWDWRVPIIATR